MGCDRLVVVLTKSNINTKPTDYRKLHLIIHSMYKRYLAFEQACYSRIDNYQKTVELMGDLERQGRMLVIRPTLPTISNFETNRISTMLSYHDGYVEAYEKRYELARFLDISEKCGTVNKR